MCWCAVKKLLTHWYPVQCCAVTAVPPVIPELEGDADTKNFEDVQKDDTPEETFPVPKAYAGNHLPFIGFTFNRDHQ